MAFSAVHVVRTNIGYIAAHVSLILSGIGLLFLQQHLWLARITIQGYGPYQSTSFLVGVSATVVIVDLLTLRWALRGSRYDMYFSMFLPALFFGVAVFVLLADNSV
ncbi:MAG: hypothetical protein JRN09_00940 [Nitrososphaerota archaeon]|jgi:uncharacterized membrane protein|nr:hypothetical protein [Nitrososphaerota archaeon]